MCVSCRFGPSSSHVPPPACGCCQVVFRPHRFFDKHLTSIGAFFIRYGWFISARCYISCTLLLLRLIKQASIFFVALCVALKHIIRSPSYWTLQILLLSRNLDNNGLVKSTSNTQFGKLTLFNVRLCVINPSNFSNLTTNFM